MTWITCRQEILRHLIVFCFRDAITHCSTTMLSVSNVHKQQDRPVSPGSGQDDHKPHLVSNTICSSLSISLPLCITNPPLQHPKIYSWVSNHATIGFYDYMQSGVIYELKRNINLVPRFLHSYKTWNVTHFSNYHDICA